MLYDGWAGSASPPIPPAGRRNYRVTIIFINDISKIKNFFFPGKRGGAVVFQLSGRALSVAKTLPGNIMHPEPEAGPHQWC